MHELVGRIRRSRRIRHKQRARCLRPTAFYTWTFNYENRLLILSLLVSVPAFAWQPQTGDIIFQISRSSQSKAIQLATHSDYSHTGMLVMRNKKPYVFEAVGPVKYTPLKQWIAHGEKGKYVVRRVEGGLEC